MLDKVHDDVAALERALSTSDSATRAGAGKRVPPTAGGRGRRSAPPAACGFAGVLVKDDDGASDARHAGRASRDLERDDRVLEEEARGGGRGEGLTRTRRRAAAFRTLARVGFWRVGLHCATRPAKTGARHPAGRGRPRRRASEELGRGSPHFRDVHLCGRAVPTRSRRRTSVGVVGTSSSVVQVRPPPAIPGADHRSPPARPPRSPVSRLPFTIDFSPPGGRIRVREVAVGFADGSTVSFGGLAGRRCVAHVYRARRQLPRVRHRTPRDREVSALASAARRREPSRSTSGTTPVRRRSRWTHGASHFAPRRRRCRPVAPAAARPGRRDGPRRRRQRRGRCHGDLQPPGLPTGARPASASCCCRPRRP